MIRLTAFHFLIVGAALGGSALLAMPTAAAEPRSASPLAGAAEPHMKKAKSLLSGAKGKLERAGGSGGHTKKALGAIADAITEIDTGIAFVKKQPAGKTAPAPMDTEKLAASPRLRSALKLLVAAQGKLKQAAGKTGGHGEKALAHVKSAITHVKAAIAAG